MSFLLGALSENTSVQSVSFEGSFRCEDDLQIEETLKKFLEKNKTVKELNLSNTYLSGSAIESLAKLLEGDCKLRRVILSRNETELNTLAKAVLEREATGKETVEIVCGPSGYWSSYLGEVKAKAEAEAETSEYEMDFPSLPRSSRRP